GGHGDIASVIVALTAVLARRGIAAGPLNPFYFPTAEAHRAKLEQAGFTVEEIAILPRPTVLTSDIEPWLDAFCEAFLRGGAGTRPRHGAARHRRAVAPGLAGRGRALERRLRPAAVARPRYPQLSQGRDGGRQVTLRSAGVVLCPAGDIGMGGEPHAGPGLRQADQLLDDPDPRAIADDVRVHGQLEQPAILVGRL